MSLKLSDPLTCLPVLMNCIVVKTLMYFLILIVLDDIQFGVFLYLMNSSLFEPPALVPHFDCQNCQNYLYLVWIEQ